ncbi:putative aminotransferase [Gordonia hirsuta DSM 44140 = NBRC 16056]|uniref:Aminotransferase n=1 Tax=Gordonia hirsuta DSM 44140 = NBRC 16056 TaxID=1121927 RepID=L7LAJ6_9ACTN|nr:Rv2231c family pyridoxal phosphate-dependent protein CobC [Gordonia hirsuta]GAC57077.1 putative aminotransferase [Gordonia hirsuta DSM 44140 = NBRC 16056]
MSHPHRRPAETELLAPERHGDADAEAGVLDFAVNVQPGPPGFVRTALAARLDQLAAYPSRTDERRAVGAAAARHGRRPEEVLLLDGAAEGFELLARLAPRHVALIEPSFTEPGRVLRATGARISTVVLPAPWHLDAELVPADADLVVLGNPTNPTSVLHPAEQIRRLCRPGRLVVVDEAFADLTADPVTGRREPESLAAALPDGVIVIRSLTKTFGLAGLRIGYLLAAPAVIARLSAGRRHWPLGTLALAGLTACLSEEGDRYTAALAERLAVDRGRLLAALAETDIEVCAPPHGPYVLIRVPDGLGVKAALRDRGLGVRSCANFTGLSTDHLRVAVRSEAETATLIAGLRDVLTSTPGPS